MLRPTAPAGRSTAGSASIPNTCGSSSPSLLNSQPSHRAARGRRRGTQQLRTRALEERAAGVGGLQGPGEALPCWHALRKPAIWEVWCTHGACMRRVLACACTWRTRVPSSCSAVHELKKQQGLERLAAPYTCGSQCNPEVTRPPHPPPGHRAAGAARPGLSLPRFAAHVEGAWVP